VNITKWAKPSYGLTPHWLKKTIATRGEIVRDNYTLLLEVAPDFMGSALYVSFVPRIGQRIDPLPYEKPGNCAYWVPPGGGAKWRTGSICSARDGDDTLWLRFNVTDRQGNIQGTESIQLTVVANGYYVTYDGI
jgi:hypothetical protein